MNSIIFLNTWKKFSAFFPTFKFSFSAFFSRLYLRNYSSSEKFFRPMRNLAKFVNFDRSKEKLPNPKKF